MEQSAVTPYVNTFHICSLCALKDVTDAAGEPGGGSHHHEGCAGLEGISD